MAVTVRTSSYVAGFTPWKSFESFPAAATILTPVPMAVQIAVWNASFVVPGQLPVSFLVLASRLRLATAMSLVGSLSVRVR
jgi:hypothetical protein